MKIFSNKRGFSIVEMLIYITILVLMLGVIMGVVISVINSGRVIGSLKNVENSVITSLERLVRETRQAGSINLGSSVLESHPGRLVLEGTDIDGNPRTVEFYLAVDTLMFRENGIDIGALTQKDTRVTNLVFRRFSSVTTEGVRVEISLESGTSTNLRSNNFYFSAVLR